MTPMTMKETLPSVLSEKGATPKTQDAIKTATGVVAWRGSAHLHVLNIPLAQTHLKHLNERHGEVQVSQITADEREREHQANWHDSSEVDSAIHGDLLAAIQRVCRAGEDLGHEGRESQMPCRQDDGVVELGGVENPFVEDDDTGGERYPGRDVESRM